MAKTFKTIFIFQGAIHATVIVYPFVCITEKLEYQSAMPTVLRRIRNYFRESRNKFPAGIGVTMFINMIFYAMVSTVLFSFLPKMVKYFGASEVDTGSKAGLIASSFYIGQFFFSMIWGYIADTMNKKLSLILAAFSLIATTIAFGLSRSFYWALISRFFQGSSMGQLIIFKAIVTNICDDGNVAFGLSILMSAFTVGSIIGPSIGGFLAFPAEQYPKVFSHENLFGRFGILLPNFVLAIGVLIGMFLVVIFVKDPKLSIKTNSIPLHAICNFNADEEVVSDGNDFLNNVKDAKLPTKTNSATPHAICNINADEEVVSDGNDFLKNVKDPKLSTNTNLPSPHAICNVNADEEVFSDENDFPNNVKDPELSTKTNSATPHAICNVNADEEVVSDGNDFPNNAKDPELSTKTNSPSPHAICNVNADEECVPGGNSFLYKLKDSKISKVLHTKEALLASILYTLYGMVDIGYNEILPVLTSTSPKYKGMGFTPSQIGTILMIAPGCYFIPQFTVIPKLITRYGPKATFIAFNLLLTLCYPILPIIAAVHNRTLLYVCLVALIIVIRMNAFGCSLAINIMINNSVAPDLIGTVNGVALSAAALGRLIAPIMFGSIYSWSLRNIEGVVGNQHPIGFPLNQFLTFYILSFFSMIIAALTTILPDAIDNNKT